MIVISDTLSIPDDAIKFHFYRAGGPGGQNVNKVSTAVQLRYDLSASADVPHDVKQRLTALAGSRMTLDGMLIIASQKFRTQERNKADAIEKFINLIRKAEVKPVPRKETKPPRSVREKRLTVKKIRKAVKSLRRSKDFFEH